MKNKKFIPAILMILLLLSGCDPVGEKASSLSLLYAATTVLSFIMLLGLFLIDKKRQPWLIVLFICVAVVNTGYWLLSISNTLAMALYANRLSYFGSVFLPLSMLMIILNVTGIKSPKFLSLILSSVSILIFLLAASYPTFDWYYKDVALHIETGAAHLDKEYGPLHCLYLYYLIAYFAAMISVSIYAAAKKKLNTPCRTITLCAAVFINIGVWLVEQLVAVDFEILSITYIITELLLLGLHMVTKEIDRLRQIVSQTEQTRSTPAAFAKGLAELTQAERTIYNYYIEGRTTKEIMVALSITENTLKFHNKNIYGKLGVRSRKELIQIAKKLI